MKKYLLTFGGKEFGWSRHNNKGIFRDYYAEAERLIESAKKWDVIPIHYDCSIVYVPEYYPKYKETLDRTGWGFAFKPIGYWKTLNEVMEEGDVAVFIDSNHVVAQDPSIYFQIAEQNSVFAQDHIWTYYPNKDWTHRDTFVNMGCDEEKYWNAPQLQCNVTGIKKDAKGMAFAKEYLDCCLDWRITFGEGKYPDFPSYKENRHNQSVFSILCAKHGIPYLNRTNNVWMEYIFQELDFIEDKNPPKFDDRKNSDMQDLK